MKKKLVSALLVSTMAVTAFVGCGSSADTTEDAATTTDDTAATTEEVDPVANLIASTDGTVTLQLWCSETDEYQKVMSDIVEKFKAQYSDVDFDITLGAVSEADTKDRVLEDVEAAADVYVFADDQIEELVKAGALQEVVTNYTYDVASESTAASVEAATVDGKLTDRFGDNGVVTVVIASLNKADHTASIDLWLMSCRVLKRDMEFAMMDALVEECKKQGITTIMGHYIPTAKNKMVADFYQNMGYEKVEACEDLSQEEPAAGKVIDLKTPGTTHWRLDVASYTNKNTHIKVN